MSDLYEATFTWPHTEPKTVILTGTFDHWSGSVHMTKESNGFTATVKVPYGEKVYYKFIVDGNWQLHDDQPSEPDRRGLVNNYLTIPSKPANGSAKGNDSLALPKSVVTKSSFPKLVTDLADTIAAGEGARNPLSYVASGLGVAIQSVVGYDPINQDPIAIPTPATATSPRPEFDERTPVQSPVQAVAPIIPLPIVPVNDATTNSLLSPVPAVVATESEATAASPAAPSAEEATTEASTHGLPIKVPSSVAETAETAAVVTVVPAVVAAAKPVAAEVPAPEPAAPVPEVVATPTAAADAETAPTPAESEPTAPVVVEVVATASEPAVVTEAEPTPAAPVAVEASAPSTETPALAPAPEVVEPAPLSSVPEEPDAPLSNGTAAVASGNGTTLQTPPATPSKHAKTPSSVSVTPSGTIKNKRLSFPRRSSSPDPTASPPGSIRRKKRDSFIQKVKHVLHLDGKHEKEEKVGRHSKESTLVEPVKTDEKPSIEPAKTDEKTSTEPVAPKSEEKV